MSNIRYKTYWHYIPDELAIKLADVIDSGSGSFIGYNQVEEGGVPLVVRNILNFSSVDFELADISSKTFIELKEQTGFIAGTFTFGSGSITVNDKGIITNILSGGGGGSGYDLIQNNGVSVTQRTTINLATRLVASDAGSKTVIDLENLGVAGTFTVGNGSVTLDNYGRVTAKTNPSNLVTGTAYQTVEGNGTPVTQRSTLNFAARLTPSDSGGKTLVDLTSGIVTPNTYSIGNGSVTVDTYGRVTGIVSPSNLIVDTAYQTVENNGTPVTQRSTLNFTPRIVAQDSGGKTSIDLQSSVVSPGSFTVGNGSVTVDTYGRVTAYTNTTDLATDSSVVHLAGAETITGRKTFPSAGANAAVIPAILGGGTGTNGHVVPNVADDTFTLNAATQTLVNKTIAATLSNSFSIGDGAAGAKTLLFTNTSVGTVTWNPSTTRTLTLPDVTGTVLTDTSGGNAELRDIYSYGSSSSSSTIVLDATRDGIKIEDAASSVGTMFKGQTTAAGAVLWDFTGNSLHTLKSAAADGASAVALAVDTTTTWSNSTAKLLSLRTNGTEKVSISQGGTITVPNGGTLIASTGTSSIQVLTNAIVIVGSTFRPNIDLTCTNGSSSSRWTEVWGRRFGGVEQTIAAAATITVNPASGEYIRITLGSTAITTVNASSGFAGEIITTAIIQDSTGGRSISGWSSSWVFTGGSYTVTSTADKRDLITWRWDATASKWYEIARSTNL